MSDYLVTETELTYEADRIRAKTGGSSPITFVEGKGFGDAIDAIPTGITPTGTINIISNGTYDVTDKATALVNVPGSTPTGTKQISISANGTTTEDVAAYANAEITVNVPSGGGSATHVQYTAASDATSTGAGGNTSAFYNAYIDPNIPSSGNVIAVCFITNNNASGNYGRAVFMCRDTKLRGSYLRVAWRGASGTINNFSTNIDFFYTSGSLIDVWVLTDPLPIS